MLSSTMLPTALSLLLLAVKVSSFGCATHTFTQCGGITHWYDPDDGQICDPLDCGGGRAPPKTTDPCCGGYKGTASCVKSTSYLSCFVKPTSSLKKTTKPVVITTSTSRSAGPTPTISNASSTGASIASNASTGSTPQSTGSMPQSTNSIPQSTDSVPQSTTSIVNDTVPSSSNVVTPTSNATSAPTASASNNAAYALQYDWFMAIAGIFAGNMAVLV